MRPARRCPHSWAPTRAADLVDEVYERSQGNAYLTEMLVSSLDAGSVALPDGLPAELSEALLSAWRRLGAPARARSRLLAVAGGPATIAAIREVLRRHRR